MSALELPLHFLRPWWWLALLPLPAVLVMLARGGDGRAALASLADTALLRHLVRAGGARRRMALVLFTLAWLLAVAALAGPAWQKVPTPLYVNGAARVVALSLSNDMLAQDLKPDRMTRARFAVRDLLDGAGDARTALVAYAGAAFVVAPLTDDKRTVLNLLQTLQPDVMPVPGNDGAAGIRQGVQLLRQAHVRGGEIVLVAGEAGGDAVTAARTARAGGVRVDVLGVGTTEGAPVPRHGGGFASGVDGVLMAQRDDQALRAVAEAGGGRYVVLPTGGIGMAAFAAPVAGNGHANSQDRAQLWRDGGVWLLPILVVLAALAFRRGWLLVIALCVLPPVAIPAAHASTWSSLWANRDQRALQALHDGDAARAQALARTSGLRGAASYRAGDYAGAAKAFAQGGDARAHYNLGNALAKQGDYARAIEAYRESLRQDPKLADARRNLDAVEAWLKHHSPPPSQGKGQKQSQRAGQPGQRAGGSSSSQHESSPSQGQSSQGQDGSSSPGASSAPQGTQAQPGAPARGKSQGAGATQDEGAAAAAAEAARQKQQAEQAARGLRQELGGARKDKVKPGNGMPQAFALGQSEPRGEENFDAQQRAMLRAVPDDPGALLRRKFRLEWEQRSGGQAQENRQ